MREADDDDDGVHEAHRVRPRVASEPAGPADAYKAIIVDLARRRHVAGGQLAVEVEAELALQRARMWADLSARDQAQLEVWLLGWMDLGARVVDLEVTYARMKDALQLFGQHITGCRRYRDEPCDCGLDDARALQPQHEVTWTRTSVR